MQYISFSETYSEAHGNIPRAEETSDLNDPIYEDPRLRHSRHTVAESAPDGEQCQTPATSASIPSKSYTRPVPPVFPELDETNSAVHEQEYQTSKFQVAVNTVEKSPVATEVLHGSRTLSPPSLDCLPLVKWKGFCDFEDQMSIGNGMSSTGRKPASLGRGEVFQMWKVRPIQHHHHFPLKSTPKIRGAE